MYVNSIYFNVHVRVLLSLQPLEQKTAENERVKKDLTHTWHKELKKLVCEAACVQLRITCSRAEHLGMLAQ